MERRLISNSVYNRLPELLKELTINFEGREKDIVLLYMANLPMKKQELRFHIAMPMPQL